MKCIHWTAYWSEGSERKKSANHKELKLSLNQINNDANVFFVPESESISEEDMVVQVSDEAEIVGETDSSDSEQLIDRLWPIWFGRWKYIQSDSETGQTVQHSDWHYNKG